MKAVKIISSLLLVSAMFGAGAAHAGFDLKKAAGLSGGDSGTTANAADVAKNTDIALGLLSGAEKDMVEALAGKEAADTLLKNAEGLKKGGDVTGSKGSMEYHTSVHNSAQPMIEEATKKGEKLNADQKKKLLAAAVEYAKGMSASKDLLGSIQSLAKNPTALGSDAGSVLYAAKNLPAIISSGSTTTANLTKIFNNNEMDAKKLMGDSKSDK